MGMRAPDLMVTNVVRRRSSFSREQAARREEERLAVIDFVSTFERRFMFGGIEHVLYGATAKDVGRMLEGPGASYEEGERCQNRARLILGRLFDDGLLRRRRECSMSYWSYYYFPVEETEDEVSETKEGVS